MTPGAIAIIEPADADDPMAQYWKGERVTILRQQSYAMTDLVFVQLVEPVNGATHRMILRAKDIKEIKP